MQILTTLGYRNITDVSIGDDLVAYEVSTDRLITNNLLEKVLFPNYPEFEENHGEFTYYVINGLYKLYKNQSIWRNLSEVVHASELNIGDVIYDDMNNDIIISSIDTEVLNEWWKLTVSGDHSYIADGLTLHNASRYWVGGGSTVTWVATASTNWASTSGGSNNATVPTSTDDVIFDGIGASANGVSNISSGQSVLSYTVTSGYTGSTNFNAQLTVSGNVSLGANMGIGGVQALIVNATGSMTSNGRVWPNALTLTGAFRRTFIDDWVVFGNLSSQGSLSGGKTITLMANLSGTSVADSNPCTFSMGGTGSISTINANNTFNTNSIVINTNGTITFGAAFSTANSSLTYISGTVSNAPGATFFLGGSGTFSTNGMSFNNFTHQTTSGTIFNYSPMTIAATLSIISGINSTWAGSHGFSTGYLSHLAIVSSVMTLQQGTTYSIVNGFSCFQNRIGTITSFTSSGTNSVILTLQQGASCNVLANFNRIDASRGQTIWTFNGSAVNCQNIISFSQPNPVSRVYLY